MYYPDGLGVREGVVCRDHYFRDPLVNYENVMGVGNREGVSRCQGRSLLQGP